MKRAKHLILTDYPGHRVSYKLTKNSTSLVYYYYYKNEKKTLNEIAPIRFLSRMK